MIMTRVQIQATQAKKMIIVQKMSGTGSPQQASWVDLQCSGVATIVFDRRAAVVMRCG